MAELPLYILLDFANPYHGIGLTEIATSAVVMGYSISKRVDSLIVCLAIAVLLFFFLKWFFNCMNWLQFFKNYCLLLIW